MIYVVYTISLVPSTLGAPLPLPTAEDVSLLALPPVLQAPLLSGRYGVLFLLQLKAFVPGQR